ncbi:hypothetical protein CCP3SC15_3760005 [Gammaproteobacteria bacterium]
MKRFFASIRSFLRGYWGTRHETDPEKIALALGRPATLELTREQAEYAECTFLAGADMATLAKTFYRRYPRVTFPYFMVPAEDGRALEFGRVELGIEGTEIVYAAMRTLGAVIAKEDGEYFQNAHPMVQRMAEAASTFTPPASRGGILG